METINKDFVEKNIKEILNHLRPDLVLEMLSRASYSGFGKYNGWNIKVEVFNELLGEYYKGKLVSGKWFNDEQEEVKMSELYEKLKEKCGEYDFHSFLNKLLCKGKANEGICWKEYDALTNIHKVK